MTLPEAIKLWWNPTPDRAAKAIRELTYHLTYADLVAISNTMFKERQRFLEPYNMMAQLNPEDDHE